MQGSTRLGEKLGGQLHTVADGNWEGLRGPRWAVEEDCKGHSAERGAKGVLRFGLQWRRSTVAQQRK